MRVRHEHCIASHLERQTMTNNTNNEAVDVDQLQRVTGGVGDLATAETRSRIGDGAERILKPAERVGEAATRVGVAAWRIAAATWKLGAAAWRGGGGRLP